jgi:glycerophosphoryl diester phosphodiesterase
MDVVLTKDGEVLVSHDPVLNPAIVRDAGGKYVAPGSVVVKNLTLGELRRFDVGRIDRGTAYGKFFPDQVAIDGTRMPTLREVVRLVQARARNRVGFQIEMKTDPANPAISADPAIRGRSLFSGKRRSSRVKVHAFDFTCHPLQGLDRRIRTGYSPRARQRSGGVDDFFSLTCRCRSLDRGGRQDYQANPADGKGAQHELGGDAG